MAEAPLRVAVVGSGPAGFYAAGALLDADVPVEVDMLERLPTPWGLVRLGVAPDHPKLKTVSRAFERIAEEHGFTPLTDPQRMRHPPRQKQAAELEVVAKAEAGQVFHPSQSR